MKGQFEEYRNPQDELSGGEEEGDSGDECVGVDTANEVMVNMNDLSIINPASKGKVTRTALHSWGKDFVNVETSVYYFVLVRDD